MSEFNWISVKKPSEEGEWICPLGDMMLMVYESGFSMNEIYYNTKVMRWDSKTLTWNTDKNDRPNNSRVQLKDHKVAKKRIEEWYLNEYVIDKIITDQE